MSTLADLVGARTSLTAAEVEHLHRLLAEWQLVADLSFADLVLWVRAEDDETAWLAVAHMRPTTGPTAYPEDVVGSELRLPEAHRLARAWREERIVREGEPDWRAGIPVRQEAVPVRTRERVVAVLTRETNLTAARMPSQLELAYLTGAGELLQMVSEGSFPFEREPEEDLPRVGDGFLRLDRTGHVVYASPNARSASRRLGVTDELVGAHLGRTIAGIAWGGRELDEPRGSAAVAAVLRLQEPREAEVEGNGTTVQLRALPLVPGGTPSGALVLLRDVTELRRRERQLMGKDATIREIHHRVKNNLQTVAALLRLQARRTDDPGAREALEESVRRVGAIALVHETLSTSLDEQVPFDAVADRVLAACAQVAGPEADVRVGRSGSFGVLPPEVATPLSMVLNELVLNAVEHAFVGCGGSIDVRAAREERALRVEVCDDGRGLPGDFDLTTSTRLGLQIVRTLVDGELRGRLTLDAREGGGTAVVLEVPLDPA